jgi:hypothetical protein
MAAITSTRLLLAFVLLFVILDHFYLRKLLLMVVIKDIQTNNNINIITVGFTTDHPKNGALYILQDDKPITNTGNSLATTADPPLLRPKESIAAAETMQPQPRAPIVQDPANGPKQWQVTTTTRPSSGASTETITSNYITTNTHKDRLVAKVGNYHADNQSTYNYTDLEKKFYQRHHNQLLKGTLHPRDYPVFEVDKQYAFLLEHVEAYKVSRADLQYHIQQKQVVTNHSSPMLGNMHDNHLIYIPKYGSSLCVAAKLFNQYRASPNATAWPHVLLFGFHQDTGGLSSGIRGKTLLKRDRDFEWRRMGCNMSSIYKYLDHPDTIAAITCQWHYNMDHPKTYSIALGMRFRSQAEAARRVIMKGQALGLPLLPRPRELMINFRVDKRPNRLLPLQQIEHNFANYSNINTTNSFSGAPLQGLEEYFEEMLQSKFILSPGGAGFDCFRTWEALFMGVIPIIETAGRGPDGWLRTFNDLPVLVLESFGNLTPQVLEEKYHQVLQHWDQFNWEKMTFHWWVHWVYKFLKDNKLPIVRPHRTNATWGFSNVGGHQIE